MLRLPDVAVIPSDPLGRKTEVPTDVCCPLKSRVAPRPAAGPPPPPKPGFAKVRMPPALSVRTEPAAPVTSGVLTVSEYCVPTRPVPSPVTPEPAFNCTWPIFTKARSPAVRRIVPALKLVVKSTGAPTAAATALAAPVALPSWISPALKLIVLPPV